MKKFIVVALLAAFVAAPSFAADAKAPVKKTPVSKAHDRCNEEGYGMHHGMMLGADRHMFRMLNLSDDQRAKISKLSDDLDHDNWARQGLINDESARLRDLYEADKRDPAAIGEEYKKIFDLKRQMIEAYLTTQNQIDAVLTPEQRAQMKDMHHMHYMP